MTTHAEAGRKRSGRRPETNRDISGRVYQLGIELCPPDSALVRPVLSQWSYNSTLTYYVTNQSESDGARQGPSPLPITLGPRRPKSPKSER